MSRRDLRDSRIVLTGASSGIGRALALALARNGASLVLLARREDRLKTLAEAIRGVGGRVETVVGDVTEPAVRQQALDASLASFGGLDVLVNNAGVGAMGPFDAAEPQRLRRVMEVNFFALAEMTRLALPHLKHGKQPMVVNVSSILGHRGVPYSTEYCASKFAVQGFSEALRAEVAQFGIDVLVVSPGTTKTEFFDSVLEKTAEPRWPSHGSVSPEYVAERIVRAMQRGQHEIIPFTWGKVMCLLNRLAPGLMDRAMARYA
jgi:short-subunit dehydrogenase